MRITISIEDEEMSEVMQITGEKQKSRAISKAVTNFVRYSKSIDFANRAAAGEFHDWFDWGAFEDMERVNQEDIENLEKQRYGDR